MAHEKFTIALLDRLISHTHTFVKNGEETKNVFMGEVLMRGNKDVIIEMEKLLKEYEIEVETDRKAGLLSNNTVHIYILHPWNILGGAKVNLSQAKKC